MTMMKNATKYLYICYTCRKRKEEEENVIVPGKLQRVDQTIWCVLIGCVFILFLVLMYCWSVFKNDYNDFDWFIYDKLGTWHSWGLAILIVVALLFSFICLLSIVSGIALLHDKSFWKMHFGYKIVVALFLLIAIGAYIVIEKLWGEEWYTAVLALQMISPFLHLSAVVVMTILSWFMIKFMLTRESKVICVTLLVVYFVILLVLYLLPLAIKSPCIHQGVSDNVKPLIIGHRGFPLYAPENTMLSYEVAANYCDVHAVETDIAFSKDGVPVLMHDHDLLRTTNAKQIYPNRINYNPSTFTWDELKVLNAGEWFLKSDPFQSVKFIPWNVRSQISSQTIPKLSDLAKFIAEKKLHFIFDLYRPPYANPHYIDYTTVVLETLLSAGVNESDIYWMPSYNLTSIIAKYPSMVYVYQGSANPSYVAELWSGINLQYNLVTNDELISYQRKNISIIEYVITSPWLFSLSWCQGASLVTTNNCQRMSHITRPAWHMTPGQFIAMWVCVDLLSLVVISIMFWVQHSMEKGQKFSRLHEMENETEQSLQLEL